MTDIPVGHSNLPEFRPLIEADPKLQPEIARHVGNGGWDSAAIVRIGHARGLDVTAADIQAVMEQDDELSDFGLELVAAAVPINCNDQNIRA